MKLATMANYQDGKIYAEYDNEEYFVKGFVEVPNPETGKLEFGLFGGENQIFPLRTLPFSVFIIKNGEVGDEISLSPEFSEYDDEYTISYPAIADAIGVTLGEIPAAEGCLTVSEPFTYDPELKMYTWTKKGDIPEGEFVTVHVVYSCYGTEVRNMTLKINER